MNLLLIVFGKVEILLVKVAIGRYLAITPYLYNGTRVI